MPDVGALSSAHAKRRAWLTSKLTAGSSVTVSTDDWRTRLTWNAGDVPQLSATSDEDAQDRGHVAREAVRVLGAVRRAAVAAEIQGHRRGVRRERRGDLRKHGERVSVTRTPYNILQTTTTLLNTPKGA